MAGQDPVGTQPIGNPMLPAVLSFGMAVLWWLAFLGLVLLADRGSLPEGNVRVIFWSLLPLSIAALISGAVALGRIKLLPRSQTGLTERVGFAHPAALLGLAWAGVSMFVYLIGLQARTQ